MKEGGGIFRAGRIRALLASLNQIYTWIRLCKILYYLGYLIYIDFIYLLKDLILALETIIVSYIAINLSSPFLFHLIFKACYCAKQDFHFNENRQRLFICQGFYNPSFYFFNGGLRNITD